MPIPGQILVGLFIAPVNGDGVPYPGALLYSYEAGSVTPQAVYTDSDLETEHANPVEADADGRFPSIFLDTSLGYKFILKDEDGVTIETIDNVLDVGAQLFAQLAGTAGSKAVTSGYEFDDDDDLVTFSSTGGADPCLVPLPAASTRTRPITIKNLGTIALSIVRAGSDVIEGLAANYSVPAASSPNFPTVTLKSDGVSAWFVTSSHGL